MVALQEIQEIKKYISPAGLTLNEDQNLAVEELLQWAYDVLQGELRDAPLADRCIRVEGVPGSGKTTMVFTALREIRRIYGKHLKQISLTAPTHKAKRVVIDTAIENQCFDCKISTIQSQLGIKAELDDTGEDEFVYDDRKLKIDLNDLVIADEGSMISQVQWAYMKSLGLRCPPIIFLCDRDQLEPVKDPEISPIFKEVQRAVYLKTAMRYGGAIGELVNATRRNRTSFVDPNLFADGVSLQIVDKSKFFDMIADAFSGDDIASARVLAYTNKTVNFVNAAVFRESYLRRNGYSIGKSKLGDLKPNNGDISKAIGVMGWNVPEPDQYAEGTQVIFNKAISEWDYEKKKRVIRINSGTQARIERAVSTIHLGFDAWLITVRYRDASPEGDIMEMSYQGYCLDESCLKQFNQEIANIKAQLATYKNAPDTHPIKRQLKREVAIFNSAFMNFDKGELFGITYAFASTVHKAQGSGWDIVFVDLKDLFKCPNPATMKRLIYTAYSRAKRKLVIHI